MLLESQTMGLPPMSLPPAGTEEGCMCKDSREGTEGTCEPKSSSLCEEHCMWQHCRQVGETGPGAAAKPLMSQVAEAVALHVGAPNEELGAF